MRTALVLALLLVAVAVVVAQQNNPPDLEGRWEEKVCNLIPGSNTQYRRRTIIYSKASSKDRQGTFEETTQLYSSQTCDVRSEVYRIVIAGNYQFGGRSTLERFWKIDYAIARKRMEIFTSEFAQEADTYEGCAFLSRWVPNVEQDITHITCPEIDLLDKTDCPRLFDIVRRQDDDIWVGARYVGHPLQYRTNCRKIDRPQDFDRFSLELFQGSPLIDRTETTFEIQPFITTVPRAPSFRLDQELETRLESTAGDSRSAASTLSASLLVCVVFAFVAMLL